ncbi:unnamed protein product [Lymnaea stagnalis]|uniref:Ig-like domain-containing protein n=1 Tax=Lymnaea stagnalis TaxID=6523 RepID=A0AAV2I8J4_LYMST
MADHHARLKISVHHTRVQLAVLLVCQIAFRCSGNTVQWCPPAQVGTPLTLSCSTDKNRSFKRLRWEITHVSSKPDLLTSDPGVTTTTLCDFTHPPCSEISPHRYDVKDDLRGSQLQSSFTLRHVSPTDHGRRVSCRSWNTSTGQTELVSACRICAANVGGGDRVRTLATSKLLNPSCSDESPGIARGPSSGTESNTSKKFLVRRSADSCRGLGAYFIDSGDKDEFNLSTRTEVEGGKNISFQCKVKPAPTVNTSCHVRCNSTNNSVLEMSNQSARVEFQISLGPSRPWYICTCSVQANMSDCGNPTSTTKILFVLKTAGAPRETVTPSKMTPVYYITAAALALVILPIIIGMCVFIYRHGADLYSYYYFKLYHTPPPPATGDYTLVDTPQPPPPRLPPRPSVPASIIERRVLYDDTTEESDGWTEDDPTVALSDRGHESPTQQEQLNELSEFDGYLKPRKVLIPWNINCSPSQVPEYPLNIQTPDKELNLPAKPPLCGVARRASADARAAQDGWCKSVDRRTQSKQGGRRYGDEVERDAPFIADGRSKTLTRLTGGHSDGSVNSDTLVKCHYDSQTFVKGDCDSNTSLKGDCDSVTDLKELYKNNIYSKMEWDRNDIISKEDCDSVTFVDSATFVKVVAR